MNVNEIEMNMKINGKKYTYTVNKVFYYCVVDEIKRHEHSEQLSSCYFHCPIIQLFTKYIFVREKNIPRVFK